MEPSEAARLGDFPHTGPGTLAGRLMRSFWQPVGTSAELKVGQPLPIKVMKEEFTLYRGESGAAHVLAGRCAHRGTQLSIGWVEGECLRCFYHGWLYDETGQCVEQAVETPSFAAKVHIASYPVHEYLGLIFAYFGDGEPPPKPRYPEFENDVVVDAVMATVPYNFYQNMENSVDTLHVSWVHRKSTFFAAGRSDKFGNSGSGTSAMEGHVSEYAAEETEYGFVFRDSFDSGSERISYFEMPNVLHIKIQPIDAETGWRDFVAWKVPIDDSSYQNYNLTVAHVQGELAAEYRAHPQSPTNQRARDYRQKIIATGNEILAGRLRLTAEDVGELAHTVYLQDYIAQRGQGLIADREHERLGRSDTVVILLRKLWSREMSKIASGQPLKRWRWSAQLEPTTGAGSY